MHWLARAPANIALIKYMGKKQQQSNLPANASLSYTLDNLLTTVRIQEQAGGRDSWQALRIEGNQPLELSEKAQKRFLDHLGRIKSYFDYQGGLLVQSTNNFPHSSGLASSASSFAALTKCAVLALSELTQKPAPSINEQAQLSRLGSGSSCRSFYAPWVLWQEDQVKTIDIAYQRLIHQVIVISNQQKEVSSSEAHKRVATSPLYAQRIDTAEQHMRDLLQAFNTQDWQLAYQICWREFQDMHQLFNTCQQPFSYISEHSQKVLSALTDFWQDKKDGPIVTMDAGPNIHLLYRSDQMDLAQLFQQEYLVGTYEVL